MNGEPEEENLNKSEISQVFEIALKRNLPVNFEVSRASVRQSFPISPTSPARVTPPPTRSQVLKEDGPPHMKSFVVCVTVGEFSGQGEGKSKKIAKKLAAAAALAELRQLPHIPSVEKTLPRIKKKTKSIIKVNPPFPDTAERNENECRRRRRASVSLVCVPPTAPDEPRVRPGDESHQPTGADPAGQEGEGAGVQHGDGEGAAPPTGVRHAGKEAPSRAASVPLTDTPHPPAVGPTQVTVSGQSAEGMGPSKKVAKRNAAEKMLDLLGYKVPQPQPPKPALKTDEKVR